MAIVSRNFALSLGNSSWLIFSSSHSSFNKDIELVQNQLRNLHIVIILEFLFALWSIIQWALTHMRGMLIICIECELIRFIHLFPFETESLFLVPIHLISLLIYIITPVILRYNYDISFPLAVTLMIEQVRCNFNDGISRISSTFDDAATRNKQLISFLVLFWWNDCTWYQLRILTMIYSLWIESAGNKKESKYA